MPYFTKKGTGKDKGKTCVYKKDDKTKVGCTDGPIEKYMAALHIHEDEGLDWLLGPIQFRLGDIINNFRDYISVGDTIYVSGTLAMGDYEELNPNNSIELDMEPAVIREPRHESNKTIDVIFGENITNLPLWASEMGGNWVDLGNISTDDDLIITIPEKKSITESEENDLDWIKNIGGDTENFINELRTLIKKHAPIADIELDWDVTSDGGEYFGRIWLYDRFYELYKYDKFFKIVFYYLDPETDRYEAYALYENLPKNRLLTLLLNDMIDVSRRNLNESEEFDWIHQQEPEKELKKSKSYVVDVSHLRPAPMRFSHDSSLTRQDILRRFEELGYDVDGIDVDEAKYFYIEPNQGTGWKYNEYGTPIEYSYWIDYNTEHMEDPSYGGKYQLIDIDELMFLLDNNLINESKKNDGLSWIRDIEPELTVCEAQFQLNVGDVITLNEIMFWPDQSSKGSLYGVKAEVLAVDNCNKIQPSNTSKDRTILIHVDGDYVGFDEHWIRSFRPEYIERCMDGKCMFLICDDPDFGDLKITKVENKKLKESINEVAGISFESRKWADIIYNEIMSNPQEKTRLIIDGYDHPEVFDGFPIDYVVVDFHDKITGYDHVRSGYDKDGNYVVILFIQPQLIQGIRGYDLKSGLNHEFKHAYEDYQRRSKGKTNIDQTKESKDFYTQDFIKLLNNQQVVGPIKDILKYYYYVSNIEKSAFLENVYDNNPEYEATIRDILAKDFETFKNRYDLDLNWHLVNVAYDIPIIKKFKSAREFIDYSAVFLRKKALKILKKINKMKYIHGKV